MQDITVFEKQPLDDTSEAGILSSPLTPENIANAASNVPIIDKATKIVYYRSILAAMLLQTSIFIVMAGITWLSAKAHNIHWPIPSVEEIATFNFIGAASNGVAPSFLSVLVEVITWSSLGVLARSQYYLTQRVIRGKEFRIIEIIPRLTGECVIGVAITLAVVSFLRTTEIANLTLRSASIESITAISFILGFYHEDTRRLLGRFRDKISIDDDQADDHGKKKKAS
jgi:hypothetical protein